jgi:hypothetical protein
MSLILLDLGRHQSEPSGMDEGWTSAGSVQREKALEHMLLGEISRRMLLATGQGPEILKAEHDSYGYDVVLEAGAVMRHVQLKISRNDGKRAHVDVNVALAAKPGGCVLWMMVDPTTYALGPFYWFGGAPGQPLPDLGDRVALHTKADASGAKAARPNQRRLAKGQFGRLDDIDAVIAALFGEPRDRMLRTHLLSRPLDPQASGQPWLAAVRAGFYGAIPRDLEWADTVHLAHLIDGYELTRMVGLGDGFAFADARLERALRTGAWEGDALELWASLFLEHRRERMSGCPTPSGQQALLRRLVHALRAELQRL